MIWWWITLCWAFTYSLQFRFRMIKVCKFIFIPYWQILGERITVRQIAEYFCIAFCGWYAKERKRFLSTYPLSLFTRWRDKFAFALVERFAERECFLPIFPLGINQPSGKVATLSNQHLCELSKYFIQPPFLCLFKLTFNFISNPTSYISGKIFSERSKSNFASTHLTTFGLCLIWCLGVQLPNPYGLRGLKSDRDKNCLRWTKLLKNE